MAIASGPKIVTAGLLFGYDINDPTSFKGAVATNQFAIPTPDGSNNVAFSVQGTGTFQRLYSGTFDNYMITNNDVVYRYDLSAANGCYYHGNDVSITAGQWATFTFDYYISPGAGGYPVTNFLANFESAVSNSAADPTPSVTGVWKTATFTAQAGSTGTCRMLLYPGACNGTSLATSGFILYKNPQVLITSTSNNTAPFTGPFGARSDTQALYDTTGINSVIASNLAYTTTGTDFSFNGSSSSVNLNTFNLQQSWSYECWVNHTVVNGFAFLGQGPTALNQGLHVWYASSSSLRFGMYGNDTDYAVSPNTNTWYQYVFTYNHASPYNKQLYVNGVLINGTPVQAQSQYSGTGTVRIGATYSSGGSYANGKINSATIYNRILSADEVTQNFNAMRGRYGV